jgi:hypothetical protein
MQTIRWILVFALAFSCALYAGNQALIIASGESHGMLDACDCPNDPGGGMAKRATVVQAKRAQTPVLLVDAGGFAAGGIYDSYTEGRAADSVRTIVMLQAMGRLGYAAVAVGDDDLQYGGRWLGQTAAQAAVPLVSANCRFKAGGSVVRPYVIDTVAGIVCGITSVTAGERLFPYDTSVAIDEPVAALRKIWPKLVQESQVRIILSHLGEQESAALAAAFPDCQIVVNGHRKQSPDPAIMRGNQRLLQFGFQGKQLTFLKLVQEKGTVMPDSAGWLAVNADVPGDSVMQAYINHPALPKVNRSVQLDLYIMSQCPYGLTALRELLPVPGAFGAAMSIYYIGTVDSANRLTSLHGNAEVEEEKLWLAIETLYPQQWQQFLAIAVGDSIGTDAGIAKLNFDRKRLSAWVAAHGTTTLADQYRRSERLGITGSPTLLWNNAPFEEEIVAGRVTRRLCGELGKITPACDSLPECFDDRDCRAPGATGRCRSATGRGRCEFRKATVFDFIVVVADTGLDPAVRATIATTVQLFPGARINRISYQSKEGAALVKQIDPNALPLYLFDNRVAADSDFASIKSGLVEKGGWYTFREGVMRPRYFYKREKQPGKRVVFLDPLFADAGLALKAVLQADPLLQRTAVAPVIYGDPGDARLPVEERLRQEEALRWLVFAAYYRDRFPAYLQGSTARQGSSYWFAGLDSLKIGLAEFVGRINANTGLLLQQWREMQTLGIVDGVQLFVDNREMLPVANPAELERLLRK